MIGMRITLILIIIIILRGWDADEDKIDDKNNDTCLKEKGSEKREGNQPFYFCQTPTHPSVKTKKCRYEYIHRNVL